MHIFFDRHITSLNETYSLSEEESRHACRVLRLKTGSQLVILNGQGEKFIGEITDSTASRCPVKIIEYTKEPESGYDIHIAIAPTKNNDRIEWFLEKATEIGITEITLLLCHNNERKHINAERFEKILIAAMKQSKRLFLPKLNNLKRFSDFISEYPNGLIAHCEDGSKQTLNDCFQTQNTPVLIGPEGDFSPEEINLALQNKYKTITLGENRLRTETAGLYACMQAKLFVDDTRQKE
jgi:16S rRNA (uracil1498-N3)-methyltransferase